jgi:SAM-dependent methyltransferase
VVEADDLDSTAQKWDRAYEEDGSRGNRRRARLAAAVDLIGRGPGDVLDVGAGGGRLLAALHERGWTVFGVDPSASMVELARSRVPEAAERMTVARAEELPFSGASFDTVVAVAVLEYTDARRAVSELARVLRSGGRAVIGLRRAVRPWRTPADPGRPPLGLRRARELLTAAGLVVEGADPVGGSIVRSVGRSRVLGRLFAPQRLLVARKP